MFETEIAYQLPTFHNELIYFKTGSKLAVEWFKLADPIFQNWRESYNVFFKEKKPQTFNKNILCNLVTGNLDCYQEVGIFLNNYYDLHTKGQYFWNEDVPVELTELLNTWYSSKYGMFIENSLINSGIIHFRDENLITEEIRNDFKSIVDYKEATSQTT